MPQAPLPAPANRIPQVPSLINVIPPNASQYPMVAGFVNYPNMIDAATKGIKMGQAIAALPQEGRENAYQYTMAGIAKERANQIQQALKEIDKATDAQGNPLSAQQKSSLYDWILGHAGVQFGEQAVQMNPLSGIEGGLNIQRSQMDIQNTKAANPYQNYGYPGYPPPAPVAPQQPAQPQGSGQGGDQELSNLQTSEYQ